MQPVIIEKDQSFYTDHSRSVFHTQRRSIMAFFMMLSDLLSVVASLGLALWGWSNFRYDLVLSNYEPLIAPIIILFLGIFLISGLYPGIGIGPVEELRRLYIGASLGMLSLMGMSFYVRTSTSWSRAVLALTWVFLLSSLPLMRRIFRRLVVRLGFWGVPVVVVGEGHGPERIYHSLRRSRLIGFWPVLCVKAGSIQDVFPRPVENPSSGWEGKTLFAGIEIAIIVPQEAPLGAVKNVLLDNSHQFKRVIVMFEEARMGSVWFTPINLVEQLGLEVSHQLIDPTQQLIKRLVDLALIVISLPVVLPAFALIALAIKLDSKGPIFYTQKRVGQHGRELRMWKFRSMVMNADQVLQQYLDRDEHLRAEWEQNFKLKHDPRITRVGNFLRRTSLDELPQLWNVARREMSIIGPRPIVTDEIPLYGDDFFIYRQVLPGMTGMWQISGRNEMPYEERVGMDVYYVQNWSIWLDIHILLHTVLAVFLARGAY
jgi:Undecaprenyl-phosphate galactose phosphotransferase WbaP